MPLTPLRHVVVVGAGIGGLAAAAVLAHDGVAVTVLERAALPGGKMRNVLVDGRAIDAGPTVFTLRPVFEALFERLGEPLDAHLALHRLHTLARHAWADGAQLDLHADAEATVDAIGRFAGAAEARRYEHFAQRAARVFRALEYSYMRAPRPTPWSLARRAGLGGLPDLLRIAPFARLWSELQREFSNPRLQQLFGRYATYCGSSPFRAPATLMLVAHAERAGVWRVDGGLQAVAAVLAGLAAARGATLRYGAHVGRIDVDKGRVCGVQLAGGERLAADAVVFNGDTQALSLGLLGADVASAVPAVPMLRRSLSALTWNLVAPTSGFRLAHHNVFFSDAYASEFNDILVAQRLPRTPTVYVCAPDRVDGYEDGRRVVEDAATAGPERLMCLVNAPATADGRGLGAKELDTCEQTTFAHLLRCGLRIERSPASTVRTTPDDFHRMFPGTGGALYGPATHGWRASFTRPGSATRLPGLVLAGGSVHPGPGVPMAAMSGLLAAQHLLAGRTVRTSTSPSGATAMPGGISTR